VIYDPMRDELFEAERGKGATVNGKAIAVSKTATLAEALVATGFPSRKRHQNPNIHFYHEITLRSHGVRRAGSAALDLAYVAAGRLEGFWEFNLNPWDTAAGILLVEEAGGRVSNFAGGQFSFWNRNGIRLTQTGVGLVQANSILPSPVSSTAAVTPAREKAIRRGAVAFRRLSIMPMPMNPATIRAQFVGSGTAPGLVGFTGVTGVIGGVGRIIG